MNAANKILNTAVAFQTFLSTVQNLWARSEHGIFFPSNYWLLKKNFGQWSWYRTIAFKLRTNSFLFHKFVL